MQNLYLYRVVTTGKLEIASRAEVGNGKDKQYRFVDLTGYFICFCAYDHCSVTSLKQKYFSFGIQYIPASTVGLRGVATEIVYL